MDFFDYGEENKFETIIGNPPYVRYKDIPPDTKKKLNMSINWHHSIGQRKLSARL